MLVGVSVGVGVLVDVTDGVGVLVGVTVGVISPVQPLGSAAIIKPVPPDT